MLREFSAGALVLRHMQDRWWAAVIEPGRDGEPEDRKNTIALPKGNIDSGEKAQEAAIREVLEETGLTVEPVTKIADIKYVYSRKWSDNARIFKIVSFFLLRYESGEIDHVTREMRIEVKQALWIPLEGAERRLSYRGERDVIRKAQAWLKAHAEEAL